MLRKITIATAMLIGAAPAAWADDATIATATGGAFKAAKGTYVDMCGETRPYTADLIDLNADGQPELFVTKEGTCEGGRDGAVVLLYVKTAKGWAEQFSVTGIYQVLKTRTNGYADVEVGGAGSCFPKFSWNGAAYKPANKC